jgi:hypothetical protein
MTVPLPCSRAGLRGPQRAPNFSRRAWRLLAAIVTVALVTACGGNKAPDTPTGSVPPDHSWLNAPGCDAAPALGRRPQVLQQIVDNYPQSTLRPDAKLGRRRQLPERGGDANLVLAENEFREFLQFYPTNARADYAQYKLAMTHFQADAGAPSATRPKPSPRCASSKPSSTATPTAC